MASLAKNKMKVLAAAICGLEISEENDDNSAIFATDPTPKSLLRKSALYTTLKAWEPVLALAQEKDNKNI